MKLRSFFSQLRKKSEPFNRFASFISRHRMLVGVGGLLVVVLAIVALSVTSTVGRLSAEPIQDAHALAEAQQPRHPLTGEIIEQEYDELPQVFGVMVENAADAWPLSGVDEAFLVVEAPVEGNIPRLIAFFSEESETEKIGPVRSARPYYLDFNDALDAVYAHVGGSPEALDLIKYTFNTIDLDQFFQSEYFWRQNTGRYAPHNVYTSAESLISALEELELDKPLYTSWQYKDDAPADGDVYSVSIDWTGGSTYDVEWHYQSETNDYLRHQGTSVMKMEDGATVSAKNVIIIDMPMKTVDAVGRKHIDTTGEGDAFLVQDGAEIQFVRWVKEERTDRIRLVNAEGKDVRLNAGTTWIEILPDAFNSANGEGKFEQFIAE